MNTGAFGEGFPYSNFHDLNLDWIIKIAKNFLDQYTHIQEIIEQGKTDIQDLTTSGLEQLQDKADAIESLLQEWYNEHSTDIAEQLADALDSIQNDLTDALNSMQDKLTENIAIFNDRADEKVASAIASIPEDYTELATLLQGLYSGLTIAKYSNGVTNAITPVHISNVSGTVMSQGSSISLGYQLTNGRTYFVTSTANNIEYIYKYGVLVNNEWEHEYDYTTYNRERTAIVTTSNSGELRVLVSTSAVGQNVVVHSRIYDITDFTDTSYRELIYNPQIKNFSEILSNKEILDHFEWERGSLADNTGIPTSSTQRIRLKEIIRTHKGDKFWCNIGEAHDFDVVKYDDCGIYISETGWIKNYEPTETENIRIILRKTNNSTITIDNAKYFYCKYSKYKYKSHIRFISLPLIGDAILIRTEDGKNILVDIGREVDYDIVQRTLYMEHVEKIDYLIITHYHDDHVTVNGLTNLISDFDLSNCKAILPPTIPSTYQGNQWTPGWQVRQWQSNIESLLTSNNIPFVNNYPDEVIHMHLGETYFRFFNMNQTQLFSDNADYNELSLVFTMFSGNSKILFTGDMMITLEQKLISEIDYTVDIAKFGHHGLNTQGNIYIPFWQQLKPKVFVSSSPSNMELYGTNYTASGQIRFANYNLIKNIMTGISGDIIIEIDIDGFSINGKNYLLNVLDSSEFFNYIL